MHAVPRSPERPHYDQKLQGHNGGPTSPPSNDVGPVRYARHNHRVRHCPGSVFVKIPDLIYLHAETGKAAE